MRERSQGFWLAYLVVWISYGGLVGTAMSLEARDPSIVVPWTLAHTASGAAAGVAVIRYAAHRRLVVHVIGALLFTIGWSLLATAGWSLLSGVTRGTFVVPYLAGLTKLRWQMLAGTMAYAAIAAVTYLRATDEALRRARQRALEFEALRSKAELRALRAQLNPHFLFNTLHTVTSLVRRDPDAAEDALERFAALLRYALGADGTDDQTVTLAEEWALVEDYVAIEALRLGPRLRFEHDLDSAALRARVPALSVQPLVENAIRHGIGPRARGGAICVEARLEDEHVAIVVRDDGVGADPGVALGAESDRLGLRSVHERLAAIYGGRARVAVHTADGDGLEVSLRIPREEVA